MKKLKFRYLTTKAGILLSLLALLGFAACDDEDIQPEYGVPVVRDRAIKAEQEKNDSVVKIDIVKIENSAQ